MMNVFAEFIDDVVSSIIICLQLQNIVIIVNSFKFVSKKSVTNAFVIISLWYHFMSQSSVIPMRVKLKIFARFICVYKQIL